MVKSKNKENVKVPEYIDPFELDMDDIEVPSSFGMSASITIKGSEDFIERILKRL